VLSDSETHHSILTRSPLGFAHRPHGIKIVGCNKLKRIAPTLDTLSQAPVQCPLVIAHYAGWRDGAWGGLVEGVVGTPVGVMQAILQAVGLEFVCTNDFMKHRLWHDDLTKNFIQQRQAVAGG
jgi:hypothetical protein